MFDSPRRQKLQQLKTSKGLSVSLARQPADRQALMQTRLVPPSIVDALANN